MKNLDLLRKRLTALEIHIPKPTPWAPEEGSFSWCLWSELGRPIERMGYWDMYLAVAEKVYSKVSDSDEVRSSLSGECGRLQTEIR